jgi:site-specific DNA-methyltransferase (adenine-specific)
MIELFNADCMEIMAKYPDKYFDIAIVDPPYGISVDNDKKGNFVMTKHKSKNWDNATPEKSYWNELMRVSKNQIIWGGNYFQLPLKKGWICWDKVNPLTGKFSDFELAWTSFLNCDRIYKQEWIGFGRKFIERTDSIHPTQKPIRLYEWILKEFTGDSDLILDTHLGSGSIAIACHNYKRKLIACEIDPEYYNAAMKRLKIAQMQIKLF